MVVKDGNPKAASVRLQKCDTARYAGQRRHDLRIGQSPGYVDKARSDLNRHLIEAPTMPEIRELCRERYAEVSTRKMQRNARLAVAGIITFGDEASTLFEALEPDDQDRAFRAVTNTVADRLGTTVNGLVVHLDETKIHAHFTLAGYGTDGRPISPKMKRKMMSELQDDAAKVLQTFCPGIERGNRKRDRLEAGADPEDLRRRPVQELHADLGLAPGANANEVSQAVATKRKAEADLAELRAEQDDLLTNLEKMRTEQKHLLEQLQADLEEDARAMRPSFELVQKDPVAAQEAAAAATQKMRDLIAPLKAKEDQGTLSAKETKLVATYRRRLAPREAWETTLAHFVELGTQIEARQLEAAAAAEADEKQRQALSERLAKKRAQLEPDPDLPRPHPNMTLAQLDELETIFDERRDALAAQAIERMTAARGAITSGLILPQPDQRGKWWQGSAYDAARHKKLAPQITVKSWPAGDWERLTALAEHVKKIDASAEQLRLQSNCALAGLEAVATGTSLPDRTPGSWREGPVPESERRPIWDRLRPWLEHGWWREAGQETWKRVIRPAAALAGRVRELEHLVRRVARERDARPTHEELEQVTGVLSVTWVHLGAAVGNLAMIRMGVEKGGADPSDDGDLHSTRDTPLHLAAEMGRPEAVQTLLELGADPLRETTAGDIPRTFAPRDSDVCEILLQAERAQATAETPGRPRTPPAADEGLSGPS